ncbi:uncharacterized protein At4g02000-like [Eutrema salsugineum]|uniref:uncharacterized protein At4g02000-like n=1 Tax=Eutrema salsugineum TaxID=72664 RepID=UPI000CED0BD6|nr:uncharacterized protein At4g02000-like [Eutrema salsugineum]
MSNHRDDLSVPRDRRSLQEDEPIRIPRFDNSALLARFRLTLIGRTFHQGRSTEALLAFMPRAGIWDLDGRVQGHDLGNGRFFFDFETEEDLHKVLKRRPCHFNCWTFSLERWESNIRDDFSSTVTFWITIRGVPLHYWVDEAFRKIREALGHVEEVDVKDRRVNVTVDDSRSLFMERRDQFDNGDEVSVTLQYERLYRYCFTCNMILHEERNCPLLSDRERQDNMAHRSALISAGNERLREEPISDPHQRESPARDVPERLTLGGNDRREHLSAKRTAISLPLGKA